MCELFTKRFEIGLHLPASFTRQRLAYKELNKSIRWFEFDCIPMTVSVRRQLQSIKVQFTTLVKICAFETYEYMETTAI